MLQPKVELNATEWAEGESLAWVCVVRVNLGRTKSVRVERYGVIRSGV